MMAITVMISRPLPGSLLSLLADILFDPPGDGLRRFPAVRSRAGLDQDGRGVHGFELDKRRLLRLGRVVHRKRAGHAPPEPATLLGMPCLLGAPEQLMQLALRVESLEVRTAAGRRRRLAFVGIEDEDA